MTDLIATGYGIPFSQTRTYSNQQKVDFDRGFGWNWNPTSWPYFAASTLPGNAIALYGNLYNLRYFEFDPSDGSYIPQFGDLATLVHDSLTDELILTEPDGTVLVFHDLTHSTRPGGFLSQTTPGGNVLEVTQESGGQIVEMQRSLVSGSATITDSFLYQYISSGSLAGHVSSCTHQRRTDTDPWRPIVQVSYSYYDGSDSFGSLGDLRTSTRQVWDPDNSDWADVATDYYRYYRSGDTNGEAHNLKFVCGPEAFARLSASVPDPFAASDFEVSQFADNYYEYDFNDRVSLERVYAGSKTITFGYFRNPRYNSSSSSSSAVAPDYNTWFYKTVETQPDGSQQVVFANFAGQTMLTVRQAGFSGSSSSSGAPLEQWATFIEYDAQGRQIRTALPSAVTGFDENYDDLLHFQTGLGKYEYLRDHDGLLQITEYYTAGSSSSSSTPNAEPDGYVKAELIQRGQLGSLVPQRDLEYSSHTAGGVTVYPVSKEIRYPDESNLSTTIETAYAYTYHSGTTQVDQQTITLPVIGTGQNGSGTANTRQDVFDDFGNRTWSRNERGVIQHFVYDRATGALIQQIDDVDTSVVSGAPAGWTTPSGGGLNLVTDLEADDQGRTVQVLGPTHTISLNGTATVIRRATWTVYDEPAHTTRIGQGYATGSSPSYTFTLINPVQIQQRDHSERPLEEIQATRASTAGKLVPADTFAQSDYTRWATSQYTDCCLLESQRVYHTIPASGAGAPTTNYDQTTFGYDSMKRRNRVVTPGGTITFSVFDVRDLTISVFVGTNEDGATESDPTGGGLDPDNNMVLVTTNEYDDGLPGGDGNLTSQTQSVDASTSRITEFTYDWRDRLTATDGEIDFYEQRFYDNLNRLVRVDRRNTSAGGTLIGREESKYDDLSRVYQSIQYGVDPATGTVGEALTNNRWYDLVGNVAKSLPAGADRWTKTTYDTLNRPTTVYAGYGTDASYADIFDVTGDVVLEQAETAYDDASNVTATIRRQRYHNASTSATGPLNDPSTAPKARVTYAAIYPDPLGRAQAQANYGTNGGTALTRPTTIPARSDTVLVSSQTFDAAGNLAAVTDPATMTTTIAYDDAGRRTDIVENATNSSSSSSSSSSGGCTPSNDANRTTQLAYTPDGQLKTLTAVNAATGNQTTQYVYGTTLTDSDLAASLLLRSVIYPDSVGSSDQVWVTYNRQAQRTSLTDQNGTVHQYEYDLLGRPTQDRVTTLAAGLDGAIRRIETAYDVRGQIERLSSCTSATVGSGSVANEVRFAYNDFRQAIQTWQAHAGAVDTMTTPKVATTYADGSTNTIRPTEMVYPNGRTVTYDYGTASGLNDQLSRVASFIDDDTTSLAAFAYLGLGSVVEQTSPEADLQYTLVNPAGTNDPATGDIYSGLDRFGRVQDVRWRDVSAGTDLSRVEYGYDRASNRTWRANPTDASNHYDWLYGHDGLHRLQSAQRGTLNGTRTALSACVFANCWTLDETGNWSGFKQSDDGSTWSLEQSRAANPVNEITSLTTQPGEQWATPAYDPSGNMTTVPRIQPPRLSWANLAVNEWANLTVDEWAGLPVVPTYAATYDAWNRLVKLTEPEASAPGATLQENQYDARNFRIVTKTYTDRTLTETRHAYYTDNWQCVEERLGTSTTPDRQFLWGLRGLDDLILRDRTTTNPLDERLYACPDANANVTAVVNTTSTVVERYEYTPYGVTTVLSPTFTIRAASSVAWETTYAGYRYDTPTGLFHVRHRTYHPHLGTWLTRDPIEYNGGSANLQQYVDSRPLDATDPLGLESLWWPPSMDGQAARYYAQQGTPTCSPSRHRLMGNSEEAIAAQIRQIREQQRREQEQQFADEQEERRRAIESERTQRINRTYSTLAGYQVDAWIASREANGPFVALILPGGPGESGLLAAGAAGGGRGSNPLSSLTGSRYQPQSFGLPAGLPSRGLPPSTNLNPFTGPVSVRVIIVNPSGNTISVPPGCSLGGSRDGRWIQLLDSSGKPTGLRLDSGHPATTHPDPRGQVPHWHIPGMLNPDGTPWIPAN